MRINKYIAFIDLDGTITNPCKRLHGVFRKLTNSEISYSEYFALKRRGFTQKDMFSAAGIPEEKHRELSIQWLNEIEKKEWLIYDCLYNGACAFIKDLSKTYHVCLLTARRSKENTCWQLTKLGIWDMFDHVLISEGKRSKAQMIGDCASNLYGSIVIGDSEEDRQAAKDNNIIPYLLHRYEDKHNYNILLRAIQSNELFRDKRNLDS